MSLTEIPAVLMFVSWLGGRTLMFQVKAVRWEEFVSLGLFIPFRFSIHGISPTHFREKNLLYFFFNDSNVNLTQKYPQRHTPACTQSRNRVCIWDPSSLSVLCLPFAWERSPHWMELWCYQPPISDSWALARFQRLRGMQHYLYRLNHSVLMELSQSTATLLAGWHLPPSSCFLTIKLTCTLISSLVKFHQEKFGIAVIIFGRFWHEQNCLFEGKKNPKKELSWEYCLAHLKEIVLFNIGH